MYHLVMDRKLKLHLLKSICTQNLMEKLFWETRFAVVLLSHFMFHGKKDFCALPKPFSRNVDSVLYPLINRAQNGAQQIASVFWKATGIKLQLKKKKTCQMIYAYNILIDTDIILPSLSCGAKVYLEDHFSQYYCFQCPEKVK